MKSQIFYDAIYNRKKIKFLYGMEEIILEPYFIACDRFGNKVIYGRPDYSNQVKKYEYKKIANIRVLNRLKFSPVIPIISYLN
jgi:hypothetical protein